MARLVFKMNVSLDGYVDHEAFAPGPILFRHWIDQVKNLAGSIYGSGMYEIMRYWDEDQPDWQPDEHAFAAAWRNHRKWVVSRSLRETGPNVQRLEGDLAKEVKALKQSLTGELSVSGPVLAASLSALGLIDEYQLYYHPVVLGRGRPFFLDALPRLRLLANDPIGEGVVRLTYVPENPPANS